MKNLVSIFFVLLLFSCSATSVKEEKNAPIDDYLETQDLNNKKIIIIREKINNNVTIEIFEGKTFYYEGSNKYVKVEGIMEPLYNRQLWENMKRKYENKQNSEEWLKGDNWSKADFRYKNVFFYKKEKFPKPWKNEQFNFKEQYSVFSFSEPIFYDEKYVVFTIIKTSTYKKTFGGRSIVVMEKKDDKWIKIKEAGDGIYE